MTNNIPRIEASAQGHGLIHTKEGGPRSPVLFSLTRHPGRGQTIPSIPPIETLCSHGSTRTEL
jgi:hypothetical protein